MKHYVSMYYDETTLEHVNRHGHALLFVPDVIENEEIHGLFDLPGRSYSPKRTLLENIEKVRTSGSHTHKFHFSKISGKKANQSDRAYIKLANLIADGFLPNRSLSFPDVPEIKFKVMYYPIDANFEMFGGDSPKEQRLRLSETILRMLIKGACHYFYNENKEVIINNLYVDGDPNYRNLDKNRIVNRMLYREKNSESELRDYVTFDPQFNIIHMDSDHNKYPSDSDSFGHANLLQCVDLVLGSINCTAFPREANLSTKKKSISQPIRDLFFRNNPSINASDFSFSNGEPKFTNIDKSWLEREILKSQQFPI